MSILDDDGVQWVELGGKRIWTKPDANGWYPIETAPKDISILVWDEESGVNVSYFTVGVDNNSDEPREGWFSAERDMRDEVMVLDGPVTHWMPLPNPPGP